MKIKIFEKIKEFYRDDEHKFRIAFTLAFAIHLFCYVLYKFSI